MSIRELKREIAKLEVEFDKLSDLTHEIVNKIKEKKKQIKKIQRIRARSFFKYKGSIYRVVYVDFKTRYSFMATKEKKLNVIFIDSKLSPKEKQEELHIMLKRKKRFNCF